MSVRFWEPLDSLAHRCKRFVPPRLGRWICDRLDLAYGLTKAELRNTGPAVTGKGITDEINADPAEVARLRLSRQQARAGSVTRRFDDA